MFPCGRIAERYVNRHIRDDDDELDHGAEVHMLLCALDYKQTANPLTCSVDGKNMERLVAQCGVRDFTAMYDEQCTHPAVADALRGVASRCQDGDYFVFYYSGHGTNLADQSGDEEDGQDEALCLVTESGQINYHSCMTDDELADIITENVPPSCKVLIITDCCHSGTIADLDREQWNDFQAISMTGCMDNQTSGDMGKGGIFTHSMLVSIQKLLESGHDEFSVGKLYNTTLTYDDRIFNSPQDISMQYSNGCNPSQVKFPLIPQGPYISPMMAAKRDVQMSSGGADELSNPGMLQQALVSNNVAPGVLAHIVNLADDALDIDDVLAAGQKAGCSIM